MKNINSKIIITGIFFAFFAFALPSSAAAQDGRFSNIYTKNQVKSFVDQLDKSSDRFRKDFDRYMDQSNLNGTTTERDFNDRIKRYSDAVEYLKDKFNGNNPWWNNRNNVQGVITNAQPVNSMMNNLSFANQLESQWRMLRDDINRLADTFDLQGINGGGWNSGGWGSGGWTGNGNAPSWSVGTWRWVQGNNRTMNIASNGRVTLQIDGMTTYGIINNDRLVISGNTSSVTRTGNGFRTYNQATGEVSDYVSTGNNGGWGNGGWGNGNGGWGNNNGNTSTPPSWARGTWYWTNGPDRRMVIDNNGRVTLYTGGNTSYGTYYNGVITLNGEQSTVSRSGNNITTYNRSSGETSNYTKSSNGWGNGGGWNGGGSTNAPSWIVGRFVWTNGADRTFLIESNGQVTLYLGNITQVGTYSNGTINLGGNVSTVTQTRNGFRTVNQQTGEVSDYRRQ